MERRPLLDPGVPLGVVILWTRSSGYLLCARHCATCFTCTTMSRSQEAQWWGEGYYLCSHRSGSKVQGVPAACSKLRSSWAVEMGFQPGLPNFKHPLSPLDSRAGVLGPSLSLKAKGSANGGLYWPQGIPGGAGGKEPTFPPRRGEGWNRVISKREGEAQD